MDFNEYQKRTADTAIYPGRGDIDGLVYTALGLTGEAGETGNKIKKILRDDNGILSDEKRQQISDEIGGVLWYCSQVATECDLSLEAIARDNLATLQSRKQRGTLQGSGDDR